MRTSKPHNPYLVLAAALVLPGSGHVLCGVSQRGLAFLFFIVILGFATSKFAPPQASFIGQYAGGVFIYALSVLDAYKLARIRWETWQHGRRETEGTKE